MFTAHIVKKLSLLSTLSVFVFSLVLPISISADEKPRPNTHPEVKAEPKDGINDLLSNNWLLAKYDGNGDKTISIQEIILKREKIFYYMDGNQDGKVSIDEYQALDTRKRQLLVKARFAKLDLDGNGILDTAEYASYHGSFSRFDHNNDGRISSDEIARRHQKPSNKRSKTDVSCFFWLCIRRKLD